MLYQRRPLIVVLLVLLTIFVCTGCCLAGVIYVKPTGSDLNDGLSWNTAKATVQAGIDAARPSGEVWVAAGTYTENVYLYDGVALYGGFSGNEASLAGRDWTRNFSILDAHWSDSTVRIGDASGNTRIDGFVIRGGENTAGAGILCMGSPTISHNTITDNEARNDTYECYGGGIYCAAGNPTISYNVIVNNAADAATVCDSEGWDAWAYGGGICCGAGSAPLVVGNIIAGNTASGHFWEASTAYAYGGGVYCNATSTPTFACNTICDNTEYTSQFFEGTYYVSSGGPAVVSKAHLALWNNIIAFNTGGVYATSMDSRANYMYANNIDVFPDPVDAPADPLFVDRTNGDWHLKKTAPCINIGDNTALQPGWLDIDGEQRIYGGTVDIGADEWKPEAPRVVYLSPNSSTVETGQPLMLAATYSDLNGYRDLDSCRLLLNTTFSTARGMYLKYNRTNNRLYLQNDAGTAWLPGYAPGTNAILENSYCRVDCSKTTVTGSRSTLTVNWALTIKSPMAGKTCKAWMQVGDLSGLSDGYDQVGSFSVTSSQKPPSNDAVYGVTGVIDIGLPRLITTVYSDANGYDDITACRFQINTSLSNTGGIYVKYDATANKLFLSNDAGTGWLTGYAPGANAVMQNSNCSVDCARTSVTRSGPTITINWVVTVKSPMAGKTCTAWMQVNDRAGASDGWDNMGSLTMGAVPGQLAAVSVTPNSGSIQTGQWQTFTTVYYDPKGYANLANCRLLINTGLIYANAVYVKYEAPTDLIYLQNDAGTAWVGYRKPGANSALENSVCKLDCLNTWTSKSGYTITITWRIWIKPALAGKSCDAWMRVSNKAGSTFEWAQMGSYTMQ